MAISQVVVAILIIALVSPIFIRGQRDQCSSDVISVNPDADVKLALIMSVRRNDGVRCVGGPVDSAIQTMTVVQWLIEQLHQSNFVRNVKIGFDVYDDCGIPRHSIGRALDIINEPVLGTDDCFRGNKSCYIGIIGGSYSNTTRDVLYALNGTGVPVISPFATSLSLAAGSNFYRTVPSDALQIQAIIDVLTYLNMKYVAVVHTDDEYGHDAITQFSQLASKNGVCIDVIQTVKRGDDIDVDMLEKQGERTKYGTLRVVYLGHRLQLKKMLNQLHFVTTKTNITWIIPDIVEDDNEHIEQFENLKNNTIIIKQHLPTVTGALTFFKNKWQKMLDGNPESDSIEAIMVSSGKTQVPDWSNKHVMETIDTVLVYTSALQRLMNYYCNTVPGICPSLEQNFNIYSDIKNNPVISYKDINVTLEEFNGRTVSFVDNEVNLDDMTPIYDVTLTTSTSTAKIGEFRNATFQPSDALWDTNQTASICNERCPVCITDQEIPYAYLDGDTLLLGIFSMHETDPEDPFKCSKFRTSQMDVIITEAFFHSVENLYAETGRKFGALVIDDCYSSVRTEHVLSQIFSGNVVLKKPGTDENIDIKKIAAVVNTVGSSVTIPLALMMTRLNIPVISASASSPDLDDRINFPYFLRTVPSDVEQVKAMVSVIKALGWKYVSVLYTENNYGSKGKETFMHYANQSGICVAESPEGIVEVTNTKLDNNLIGVYNRLNNQKTNVVVYFGTEIRIGQFLEVLNGKNRDFIFLSSEDWGDRRYILEQGGRSAMGSITLSNQIRQDLVGDEFKSYIQHLKPETNTRNPWFTEYWEEFFSCDSPQSFHHKFNKVCEPDLVFDDDLIADFMGDQRILHTVTAVKAVGIGLNKSESELCKYDATFPCSKYFTYIEDVVRLMRQVTIDNVRVFKDDGNGNIGFSVNNVQLMANDDLDYVRAGTYNEGKLDLQKHKLEFYRSFDGQCTDGLCSHCGNASETLPITISTTSHPHPIEDSFSISDYAIIGILGFLFIVIVIMCIVIICYFKRRVTELENQLKKTAFEMRTAGYMVSKKTSSFNDIQTDALTYPDMQFGNTSPSGETIDEFRHAQNYLSNGRIVNGVVNKGFVNSEMYIHPRPTEEEKLNASNTSTSNLIPSSTQQDTNTNYVQQSMPSLHNPPYKPPSSSYGLSSHSSFKKPADISSPKKMQPRTQLAVPPCRPELPPRDQQNRNQRHNVFPENLDHMSPSVPKEKVRKVRSSPRRMVSPPSMKNTSRDVDQAQGHVGMSNNELESPRYTGSPKHLNFPGEALDPPHGMSPEGRINLAGSMEKISRV